MNDALQASQFLLAASATRPATPALTGDRTEDLYAIWKSIFERGRSPEQSPAPAAPKTTRERVQESAAAGEGERPRSSAGHHHHAQISGMPPGSTAIATERNAAHTLSSAGARVAGRSATQQMSANATATAAPIGVQPITLTPIANGVGAAADSTLSAEAEARQSTSRPTLATAATNASTASTESVCVFVRGSAVTIVVRDTTISEQEALQCAFATARELIGQSAALQQLTLNGQTLYQHSETNDSRSPSALMFAC